MDTSNEYLLSVGLTTAEAGVLSDVLVMKRDGRTVPFDAERIVSAVGKACRSSEYDGDADALSRGVALVVCRALLRSLPTRLPANLVRVDAIHDLVESALMDRSKDVATEYIRYRNKRSIMRKADTMEIFRSIVAAQANEITRENANMNADTPAGMMMKFASESAKTFVDEELLSPEAALYVKENIIHIHDKDYYPTRSLTCIQHPTGRLLAEGFVDGHASVRPARRIETAATLACISMEAVQNEMHGGQAIPAFDFYMAPYVRMAYEEEVQRIADTIAPFHYMRNVAIQDEKGNIQEMTFRDFVLLMKEFPITDYIPEGLPDCFVAPEPRSGDKDAAYSTGEFLHFVQLAVNRTVGRVHQAMESFVHNMNTIHSRGGNQVVFSSINYGTDTSPEGRCVIREMLNTTYEGVGDGATAIFPIQIWKVKDGVNYRPGDPNYDLYRFATKVTARRFFPNYLNLDAPFNRDEAWRADDTKRYEHEVATMGCRTRVYENRFGPKTSIGRGNLSFTTVNLPGLALRVMGTPDPDERVRDFFTLLSEACDVVARQLDDRFKYQSQALAKQFPMLMGGMWIGSEALGPNDRVEPVLNQGTLGIGFIGLAECLVALTGRHHAECESSQDLGLKIISFMREKVNGYCEKYRHNYSVLATPAEGLAGRFTRIDRKRFGVVPGVTDREYYTNSSHVPVWYRCTPSEKARIEAPYHAIATGGHIFYVELDGDATHNPKAVMQVVDLMVKNGIGYGSVNHNRYRCLDCGWEGAGKERPEVCPRCGSTNIDTLQRITGYLVGTTERWNAAKKAELRDRVTHGGDRRPLGAEDGQR